MNKLFTAICLTLALTANGAEGDVKRNPLTDTDKAEIQQIHDLHAQIHAKRLELLAMLEKDHPKMAVALKARMEEADKRHEERVDARKDRREAKPDSK
jgi:hypothetical protein